MVHVYRCRCFFTLNLKGMQILKRGNYVPSRPSMDFVSRKNHEPSYQAPGFNQHNDHTTDNLGYTNFINHLPVITIVGMLTIPSDGWFMALLYPQRMSTLEVQAPTIPRWLKVRVTSRLNDSQRHRWRCKLQPRRLRLGASGYLRVAECRCCLV